VNKKRATAPTNNFYPPEREKKKKEKKKKKGYTLQTAREVAAVKVFWQNTTRSATRCGDSVNRLSAALGKVKQVCLCTHLHDNCDKNP